MHVHLLSDYDYDYVQLGKVSNLSCLETEMIKRTAVDNNKELSSKKLNGTA